MKRSEFLNGKRHIQPTTVENYGRHLSNLEQWLDAERIAVEALTCDRFLAYLQTKPWRNSMQRGSLYALRSYLRWAGLEDHPIITTRKLLPKEKPTGRRFLSKDDLQRLLAACDRSQGAMRLRNKAMLHVLFDSWVRASELIDIRMDDMERVDGKLTGVFRVRTKAKPNAGVKHYEDKAISPNGTLDALNAWLKARDKYALPDDPYLFVGQVQTDMETGEYKSGGTKLTRHGVQAILNRLGKIAGVKVSAHDFRRGGATHGYEHQGLDVFDIQDALGDESLEVARGYVERKRASQLQAKRWGGE